VRETFDQIGTSAKLAAHIAIAPTAMAANPDQQTVEVDHQAILTIAYGARQQPVKQAPGSSSAYLHTGMSQGKKTIQAVEIVISTCFVPGRVSCDGRS